MQREMHYCALDLFANPGGKTSRAAVGVVKGVG